MFFYGWFDNAHASAYLKNSHMHGDLLGSSLFHFIQSTTVDALD